MKKFICLIMFFSVIALANNQVFSQELQNADKWKIFDDKKNKGDSIVNLTVKKETIDGKEYMVETISGVVTKKYEYGYVGFGVELDPTETAKIAKASKVKFKALGDGKSYKFRIATSDVTDFDVHTKVIASKKGMVVEIEVPFTGLSQEGWGRYVIFDKNKIVGVSFQTFGQPLESVDLKVFDFRFE